MEAGRLASLSTFLRERECIGVGAAVAEGGAALYVLSVTASTRPPDALGSTDGEWQLECALLLPGTDAAGASGGSCGDTATLLEAIGTALPDASDPTTPIELPLHGAGATELIARALRDASLMPRVTTFSFEPHPPPPALHERDVTAHEPVRINLALAPGTALRPYQAAAVAAVVPAAGACRSGMVVLPCGAGKTITGLGVLAAVGRSAVVVAPNKESVNQWRAALLQHTTVHGFRIKVLTSDVQDDVSKTRGTHTVGGVILLTTFSMLSQRGGEAVPPGASSACPAAMTTFPICL